jgi:hypothetical protein
MFGKKSSQADEQESANKITTEMTETEPVAEPMES